MNKNKRGYSLIELIMTITIIGVIGVAIMQFFIPQLEIFGQYHDTTIAKRLCNTAYALLEKEFRYSFSFRLDEDKNELYYTYIDQTNQIVEKGPYTEDYLMNQEPFAFDNSYVLKLRYNLDKMANAITLTIDVLKSTSSATNNDFEQFIYTQKFKIKSLYKEVKIPME